MEIGVDLKIVSLFFFSSLPLSVTSLVLTLLFLLTFPSFSVSCASSHRIVPTPPIHPDCDPDGDLLLKAHLVDLPVCSLIRSLSRDKP